MEMLNYEVLDWVPKGKNYRKWSALASDGMGTTYRVDFTGPHSEERAREYVDWKNVQYTTHQHTDRTGCAPSRSASTFNPNS